MRQAIIYCRFSPRPDAEESKSNKQQKERCRKYCDNKKYQHHPILTWCDKAISGKTIDRPGLTAAIAALQPGMVLVVDTRDRLARDMLVSLTIHQQVKDRGATVEVADGSPSRDTPEGNLMANILDAFAQYERERFARRTKAGLAKKKKNGEWLGKPPIGWRYNKETRKLEENLNEQGIIKDILSCHGAGVTSTRIATLITREHGLYRKKPWNARTVRKIIAREKKSS